MINKECIVSIVLAHWNLPTLCEQDFNLHLNCTARKMSEYGVFYGPCFPLFGLNTEIYRVNFHVQSKYGKVQTRKNSVFGHFLRSARFSVDSITLWNKPSRHGVLTVAELRFSKSLWSMVRQQVDYTFSHFNLSKMVVLLCK